MSLKYEPASEPLHIYVKKLVFGVHNVSGVIKVSVPVSDE